MAQPFLKRSLFRPLPTFVLTGVSIIVAASCVADNNEPLASSDPAEAAPITETAQTTSAAHVVDSDVLVGRVLQNAFPAQADHVLGRVHPQGFLAVDRGFARAPNDSLAMHLDVKLPQNPQEAVRLTAPGGYEIRVHQVGVEGEGVLADKSVAYQRAGGTSFWTVTSGGTEEWLHLEAGAITSDLDIAAEWEIDGATPMLMNGAVALMDDEGVARAWVTAPEAFGANGRHVDLRLSVEGNRIELFADAQGEEVLIDPGWVAVAPTTAGRLGPSVVALNNGKVLYAAGLEAGNAVPTTTQVYDPGTNTWSAGGAMTVGRYGQRECLLTTGNVLVTGGNTAMGISPTAERYNSATNTWSSAGSMTGARMFHAQAALTTGNALVAGGYDGTAMVATCQIYNSGTNTWSAAPNMSVARGVASAVRLTTGKVLVAGGLTGVNGSFTINTTAEVYDPTTNTWAPAGSLVTPRYNSTIGLLANGKVLLVGGSGATGAMANAEIYDPATNTWTATGSRLSTTSVLGGAVLGTGRFLAFGGDDGTSVYASSDLYNPTTGIWASAGLMNSPREEAGVAILTGGDALVVNGGIDTTATVMTASVDRYGAALSANGAACTLGAHCTSGFCVDGVCCSVASCSASDQCHNPGTCTAGTGVCSNPTKPNGTVCSDGNACTATDTCQAGTCSGANPVVCNASDQCHDPGTCNMATGTCSNPPKANGTICNDGNACTQTDSCQAGTCSGANPVTCTALDSCHDAGMCNTATGICSNPAKADGASCNDNNACTQTDTCTAGACTGANPVTCAALDQCHTAGTCNTATGLCSNPNKADGSMCNDSNACTQMDTCVAGACTGAMPVMCAAMDQCHDVGTCNAATGACSNPAKADGAVCNDGNGCTQTDTCSAGACAGSNPVTCAAIDQCHDAGTCDSATGTCSNPNKADGAMCDDGDACTQTDTCSTGACAGGNPVTCAASDQCHDAGVCDSVTGLCTDPAMTDGTSCDDGNGCTDKDVCTAGVCNAGMPTTCTAQDECHEAGKCDMTSGACDNPAKADGTACTGGTCQSGTCKTEGAGGAGGAGAGGSGAGAGGNNGAGGGTPGTDSGCSFVSTENSTSSSAFAGLAFAALAMLRRRRSARR